MAKNKFKIKKSWIKWILIIAILVIVGILYVPTLEKKEAKEEPVAPVSVPQVETGAQFGDLMKINYVLSYTNGTVVDTNNETLAKKYSIGTYTKGPYSFILGQSGKLLGQNGEVKAFDDALKGLEVGDKKTLEINPSEKVLAFQINMSDKRSRRVAVPAMQRFSTEKFKETFSQQPVVGNTVLNSEKYPWPFKVLNVTDKSVYAQLIVQPGDEMVIPGSEWKSQALDVGEKVIVFVQNPEIGQVIKTPYGTATVTDITKGYVWFDHKPELGKVSKQTIAKQREGGPVYDFVVWKIEKDNFIIRRINYLQQEHLKLDVEVLDITEDVKEVKE